MALILDVRTAYGTGVDKLAAELLHLATVTQCVVFTEYDGIRLSVSAGERVENIAKHIRERIARNALFKA